MKEKSPTRSANPHFSRKQWGIALATIVLAFIVGGALVILPQTFAARAANPPHILVTPQSISYSHSTSIYVKGYSFGVNENVNVYFNYTGPGTGVLESTVLSSITGQFLARFGVPLVPTGTYTIAAIGQTSGDLATGSTSILPQIYLNPRAAGAGTKVYIFGNAFGAYEAVNIYWNYTGPGTGTLLTTATGNSTGSFTTTARIPNGTAPGTIPVAGIGQSSQASATFGFILYPPLLTLAPLSGSPGTSLTLSAVGFAAFEKVNFYWNNGSTPIASYGSGNFGYIAPFTFTVPGGTAPGNYTIKAVGTVSRIIMTNTFSVVAPTSFANNTSGPIGSKLTISGNGYTPGEAVNIQWNYNGPGTGSTVATATATFSGAFTTSFLVPNDTVGSYQIAAIGASSQIVTQQTFNTEDSLAVDPLSASPGNTITVTGTGFQAGESVQLFLDSTSGTQLASATADSNGNITAPVSLPTSIVSGAHTVIGFGETSSQSFSTSLTINTNWGDFGFDSVHSRFNPYEYGVGTTNVGDLTLKWSAAGAQYLRSSPVYANGSVYIGTHDGLLIAYNATTGAVEWQFKSDTGFEVPSSPLVDPANNLVFFGTMGFEESGIPSPFYALDATTGQLEWSLVLPWNNFGFPTLEMNTIYIGSSHEGGAAMLNAIDELSGHILWQHATNGGVWGAVAADTTTKTVFSMVGNPSDQVLSLNATTGALNWTFSVPNSGPDDDPGSGIVVATGPGLIYVNSKNGTLYAIHEADGTLAWSIPIGPANIGNVSTPALAPDGTLYVGSLDNHLYAINATTGAILHTTTVSSGIDSSPAIANGVVYFASFDKHIYAVDASTGTILWSFATTRQSYGSPVMVNGWLYCTSTDGNIYAFSL